MGPQKRASATRCDGRPEDWPLPSCHGSAPPGGPSCDCDSGSFAEFPSPGPRVHRAPGEGVVSSTGRGVPGAAGPACWACRGGRGPAQLGMWLQGTGGHRSPGESGASQKQDCQTKRQGGLRAQVCFGFGLDQPTRDQPSWAPNCFRRGAGPQPPAHSSSWQWAPGGLLPVGYLHRACGSQGRDPGSRGGNQTTWRGRPDCRGLGAKREPWCSGLGGWGAPLFRGVHERLVTATVAGRVGRGRICMCAPHSHDRSVDRVPKTEEDPELWGRVAGHSPHGARVDAAPHCAGGPGVRRYAEQGSDSKKTHPVKRLRAGLHNFQRRGVKPAMQGTTRNAGTCR